MQILNCFNCKTDYKVYPSVIKWNKIRGHKNNFCSPDCRARFYVGENNPNWNGGRYLAPNGYIRLLSKDERCNFRYEHRVVMENHIGRRLKKREQIHHINGIKHDNRIENLLIVLDTEHKNTYHPNKNGEESASSKLTWKQVREIRKKYKTKKYTLEMLGKEYGVIFQTISLIILNKTWKERNA